LEVEENGREVVVHDEGAEEVSTNESLGLQVTYQ
jgi:hypothetical protein